MKRSEVAAHDRGPTRLALLAECLIAHAGCWLDARDLARLGGPQWRDRLARLRQSPYNFAIERRQRVRTTGGAKLLTTEYRLVPGSAVQERRAS